MPNSAKDKQKAKEEKEWSAELNKAMKMQKHLQTLQKNLEQEYSRLDVEFLQLASLVANKPQNLISESTPVVFEVEEEINKKNILLPQLQPIITTSTRESFPEEEEENEDF